MKKNVIIIEDQADQLQIISEAFIKSGFNVSIIPIPTLHDCIKQSNYTEILNAIEQAEPDMIALDILDEKEKEFGVDIIKEVRQVFKEIIPIVIISGNHPEKLLEYQAISSGIWAIKKPGSNFPKLMTSYIKTYVRPWLVANEIFYKSKTLDVRDSINELSKQVQILEIGLSRIKQMDAKLDLIFILAISKLNRGQRMRVIDYFVSNFNSQINLNFVDKLAKNQFKEKVKDLLSTSITKWSSELLRDAIMDIAKEALKDEVENAAQACLGLLVKGATMFFIKSD